MLETRTYEERRGWLETYFDRTAAETWAKLTTDGQVSRIRATVREGRERMAEILFSYLPERLDGQRVFDAGCGTGTLSLELARRGAEVVAVDLSPTLVQLASERAHEQLGDEARRIDFRVGDMLDPAFGRFDHVVAMDSLIHYEHVDLLAMLAALGERCDDRLIFTVAPKTAVLSVMHAAGKLFPRSNRSPRIVPTSIPALRRAIADGPAFQRFHWKGTDRVDCGFYISQGVSLHGGGGATE